MTAEELLACCDAVHSRREPSYEMPDAWLPPNEMSGPAPERRILLAREDGWALYVFSDQNPTSCAHDGGASDEAA
jgi:hypothetical protein